MGVDLMPDVNNYPDPFMYEHDEEEDDGCEPEFPLEGDEEEEEE